MGNLGRKDTTMQNKNKTIIQLILAGMLVVNLLLVVAILIPTNPAEGAAQVPQPKPPAIQASPMQHFLKMNQAVRQFWVGLLPFWDE